MTTRRPPSASRTLRWVSALLAVGCAAVVTGAVAAWFQGLDDADVTAVGRPRSVASDTAGRASAPVAPRPAPRAAAQPAASPAAAQAAAPGVTTIPMGAAGVVLVEVSNGALVVRGVRPGPGWTVERARAGDQVDVRVRNGRAETRVEASLVGGEVVPRVRTKS